MAVNQDHETSGGIPDVVCLLTAVAIKKMSENDVPSFGITDYCLFASMLTVSTAIGIVMSFKGNQTPDDYLLGSRALRPIPIAMSLLTSVVSSISLLGFSGEAYAYGLQFSLLVAGIILAIIFCYFFTLPVFFPLRLTSVNEYIEMRFKSKGLRRLVLLLSILQGFVLAGICLYAPTIALSSVTPLNTTTYIYLLGVLCTLYSTIGGIKAVVWTDVFQLSVVVVGLAVITILGCINLGGIMNVWTIAKEGGRFDMFRMDLGIYGRHTLPNMVLHGFFYFVALYGASQINLQRMSCLPTIKDAKLVLLSNIAGYLIVYFLVFTSGLVCYATYVGCDPLKLKKISKSDQILTFFVIDKLGYIIGLPGLFVATIIGGSLSSVSSIISAQASMIWKDGLQQFKVIEKTTPKVATFINKALSLLVGVAMIGVALWASQSKSLVDVTLSISSGSYGPILGIFILGLFFPRCNTKGAWLGIITSWLFICWITVGGLMYRPKTNHLPLSIDNCSETTNSSSLEVSSSLYLLNETSQVQMDEIGKNSIKEFEFPLMWLYCISATLYPVIGTVVCVIIGLIASIATGSQNLREVSPELITPWVKKLYWSKVELKQSEHIRQQTICNNGVVNNGFI